MSNQDGAGEGISGEGSLDPKVEKPDRCGRSVVPFIAGLAVAGVIIGGVILIADRGGSRTLRGTLTVPITECSNVLGADVTIRDESDKVIATTSTTDFNKGPLPNCTVEFTATSLPKASFYQVTIGTHEGSPYSYADLVANKWTLNIATSGILPPEETRPTPTFKKDAGAEPGSVDTGRWRDRNGNICPAIKAKFGDEWPGSNLDPSQLWCPASAG